MGLLIGCLPQTHLFAVEGKNLIPGDSSFETEVTKSCVDRPEGPVTWAIDSREKYDGRKSLKLYFTKYGAMARGGLPVSIASGQGDRFFTLSLYARSEQDGVRAKLRLIKRDWNQLVEKEIKLSRTWKRFALTGKLSSGQYWIGFEALPASNVCAVWVDAYQLEEGKEPTAYQNRETNLGINIQSEYESVFYTNESVKINFQALVRNEPANHLQFACLINDYYGRTVFEKKKEMLLDKEGYGEDEVVLSNLNPGFYAVRAGLKTKQGRIDALSTFVVVRPPVEIEKGQVPFCGMNAVIRRGFERAGLKWQEILTNWERVEETKGCYDWSYVDRMISETSGQCRTKLTIAWLPGAPKWAWDKADLADCETRKIKPNNLMPATEYLADWREFVRRLAERYKDKVDIIEVGAEDDGTFGHNPYYLAKYKEYTTNGWLTAGPAFDRYVEMISSACHEIRKAAPRVKIGVIRPWECTHYTFSEAVLRQCGANLEFDLFPLDCYTYPRVIGPGRPVTAMPDVFLPASFSGALAMCRKYAHGQQAYVSEFGYTMDINVPPDSEYAHEMIKRLARAYLIARATKGIEFLQWHRAIGGEDEDKKCLFGVWRYHDQPLPSVAAYSAVAQIVENVLESKDIFPEGGVKVVVFRKKNQADAAIWMVKGKGKVVLHNVPKNMTIIDVMGAPAAGEKTGDKTIITISEEPVYLNLAAANIFEKTCDYLKLTGINSFDRLCDLLASAELRIMPVQIQLAMPRVDQGVVILHNQAMHDLTASVVCAMGNIVTNHLLVAKGGKAQARFVLPGMAEGEKNIMITADCGVCFEEAAESFTIGGYMVCERMRTATMNGERHGRSNMVMNSREQIMPPDQLKWEGPNDLSAVVWTGWDETNFYFSAEVRDNMHFNGKAGNDIWNGDSIQMAFAPLAMSDMGTSGYGPNDTELVLALAQDQPAACQGRGPGKAWQINGYAVKRDEAAKLTRYEAAIPWSALGIEPKAGKIFGFNFVIFDDDSGAGPNFWYQLSPGITSGKNPALFKRFILSD